MDDTLSKAMEFATPLLGNQAQPNGELTLDHAQGVQKILQDIDASNDMQAAIYLAFACDSLNKPKEVLLPLFELSLTELALATQKIFQLQKTTREKSAVKLDGLSQLESVRRLLLAFSKDLRVIMLLLASQLQGLRFVAAQKIAVDQVLAKAALDVFAPLANRLGIWQLKWEMEDLAFRLLEPDDYKQIALQLESKRHERELEILAKKSELERILQVNGLMAEVQGRPKHIYSIVKKMRGKSLHFNQVFDLRAFRIILSQVPDCYRCLSLVHEHYTPVEDQYDDYIAKPKPNGYQSLHTVVRDSKGHAMEIQIRTQTMHQHAEFGVAAHWAYKEAGSKGYGGVSAASDQTQKVAVLRQLLAWERDISAEAGSALSTQASTADEKIYVLTPDASIIELTQGATPIDFAYAVHTELGHRCRGAKVDGILVPLTTPLRNGQTVDITAVKEGGPSRDWLNPDLKFISSQRSKSKVRAWFNFQQSQETIARGRELVEKLLQREGRTALKFEELAKQLGFVSAENLFEVIGKDEYSLKQVEASLRPAQPQGLDDEKLLRKFQHAKSDSKNSGVLVVGVDSLLTQLAKCCKPLPPDEIKGFVTKGKGVSVHRIGCSQFMQLQLADPGRVIEVAWHQGSSNDLTNKYAVDILVLADDRQGLLRDVSEIFAKEKFNVVGVKTQSVKDLARMTFTVELVHGSGLNKLYPLLQQVRGVRLARRA